MLRAKMVNQRSIMKEDESDLLVYFLISLNLYLNCRLCSQTILVVVVTVFDKFNPFNIIFFPRIKDSILITVSSTILT